MKRVFADTFYWVALSNPDDSAFSKVLDLVHGLGLVEIVTTDEVLTEFLAFCSANFQLRVKAAAAADRLLYSLTTRVIPQTRASFLSGLELYRSRPDKRYSLTDCISMQTMRHEGLSDVLTNDQHFQQEGFRALFRKA